MHSNSGIVHARLFFICKVGAERVAKCQNPGSAGKQLIGTSFGPLLGPSLGGSWLGLGYSALLGGGAAD